VLPFRAVAGTARAVDHSNSPRWRSKWQAAFKGMELTRTQSQSDTHWTKAGDISLRVQHAHLL
jgi:hypothetical protein